MKEPVIIVTTGHAGSSAFVEVLNNFGMFIGKKLSVAHKKFFENRYFQEVNRKILGGKGYPYPFMPAPRSTVLDNYMEDEDYINTVRTQVFETMCSEGLKDDMVWGFKDPRTCLTFPFWNKVFPNAKTIMLNRRVEDTHHGWHSKGDDGYFYYLKCFVDNIQILISEGKDYFKLEYDDLSFKWTETIKNLTSWVGLDINVDDIERCRDLWKPKYNGKVIPTKG